MTEAPEKFTKRDVASHPNPNCLWVRLVPYDELQAEADTLRAEVARLRASLQVTAAVLQAEMGRTGGKPFTGWWTIPGIDRRLTCRSVLDDANDVLSPDALAHGEADQ